VSLGTRPRAPFDGSREGKRESEALAKRVALITRAGTYDYCR